MYCCFLPCPALSGLVLFQQLPSPFELGNFRHPFP